MKTSNLLFVAGVFLFSSTLVFSQNQYQTFNSDFQPTFPNKILIDKTDSTDSNLFSESSDARAFHSNSFNVEMDQQKNSGNLAGQHTAASSESLHPIPAAGTSGYSTSLGLRGGYTSGISFKHFLKSNAALEVVLGTRWEGFSLTALYEWHSANAFGEPQLTWEYGLGARVANYRGDRYYDSGWGRCNSPNNRKCGSYWDNRSLTAVGIVAIGGLEFKFDEIPITLSLDLMPVVYLNYWGGDFIDASLSVRYILK